MKKQELKLDPERLVVCGEKQGHHPRKGEPRCGHNSVLNMFGYRQSPLGVEGRKLERQTVLSLERALNARLMGVGLSHRNPLWIYEQGYNVMEVVFLIDDILAASHIDWGQQEREEGQRLAKTVGQALANKDIF